MNYFLYFKIVFTTLILSLIGCSHGPSIRFASQLSKQKTILERPALPVYKDLPLQNINPPVSFSLPSSKSKSLEETLEFTKNLVGKPYAFLDNKQYRRDCSGTVRAIYDFLGVSLGTFPQNTGENDATTIFNFVQKNGIIDQQNVALLDLVFFDNTYDRNRNDELDDKLTHVGVVEKVLPDGTIIFVHYMGKSIIRSRMNLQYPHLQYHPETKERLNHLLKRHTKKHRGLTAAKLFAGFGRFSLTVQSS